MKKIMLILSMFSVLSYGQISLGVTGSFSGSYLEVRKDTKIPNTNAVLGVGYGLEITPSNIYHKVGITPALDLDELLYIELDANLVYWQDLYKFNNSQPNPYYGLYRWSPTFTLGMRLMFTEHVYGSCKVAWPGLLQLGVGYKFSKIKFKNRNK